MLYNIITLLLLCFSYTGIFSCEKVGLEAYALEEQQNFNTDQLQQSLKEYALTAKKYTNNPYGWTALNYAIYVKDYQSALILANHCTNINKKDPLSQNSKEYINALERLFFIDYSSSKSKKYISETEIQLAYVLLDRGIMVTSGYFSPMSGACWYNIDDLIIRFIEFGANVNCNSGTPLYNLIENGNLNMASYLISHGANLKAGRVLFLAAINSQKIECLDFLSSNGLVLEGIKQFDYIIYAFGFLKNEIKRIDECPDQIFPALEIFSRILELGGDPNFCYTNGLYPRDYEQALNRCPLWLALDLYAEKNYQYLYKNLLIQVLIKYGAKLP